MVIPSPHRVKRETTGSSGTQNESCRNQPLTFRVHHVYECRSDHLRGQSDGDLPFRGFPPPVCRLQSAGVEWTWATRVCIGTEYCRTLPAAKPAVAVRLVRHGERQRSLDCWLPRFHFRRRRRLNPAVRLIILTRLSRRRTVRHGAGSAGSPHSLGQRNWQACGPARKLTKQTR